MGISWRPRWGGTLYLSLRPLKYLTAFPLNLPQAAPTHPLIIRDIAMRQNFPANLIFAVLWAGLSYASWSMSGDFGPAIIAGAILAAILLIPATLLVAAFVAPALWLRDLITKDRIL